MALLRLYFMDLIAFVPLEGRLWVLLPDGESGGSVGGLAIPSHFPVILFDTGVEDGGQWQDPAIKAELGLTGQRKGTLWRLNREEISFEGLAAPSGADPGIQVLGRGDIVSSEFPAAENVASVAWMPKMKDVVEAAGEVDPACIGRKVETDKIIARILLDKGTFKISGFASREHSSVFGGGPPRVEVGKYEFKTVDAPAGGSAGRAIADLAVAELPLEGDTVKVKAASFDGRSRRSLDLSANNGVIEAVVANVSKLLTVTEAEKEDPNRGPHFALYYKLAASAADTEPIPHRTGGDFAVSGIVQKPPAVIKELIEDRSSAFRRPVCALAQFS